MNLALIPPVLVMIACVIALIALASIKLYAAASRRAILVKIAKGHRPWSIIRDTYSELGGDFTDIRPDP